MAEKIKLTREHLSKFLPDHETIIQFEKLINSTNSSIDVSTDDVSEIGYSAEAKANEALESILWEEVSGSIQPKEKSSDVKVFGEFKTVAYRETKVISSTTETLSARNQTYINIDTPGNTLSISDMVDGSKIQINNSSSGDATLNFSIKLGATTFSSPVTMPSGDSYEIFYDSASGVWVM